MPDLRVTRAETHTLAYCGKQPGAAWRDSDAWYTPPQYVESARRVMGAIDLDPFSSAEANKIVQAKYYFSPATDALSKPTWRNAAQRRRYPDGLTVFMNPPYSFSLLAQAIKTFLLHWQAAEMSKAIILVNNATETAWFAALRGACQAICFPTHRIAFVNPDNKAVSGNTRGQAFFYFTRQGTTDGFCQEFSQYGWVIERHGWEHYA